MTGAQEPASSGQAELAKLAAVIERAAADLGLSDEPARFIAALDEGAPAEAVP